MKKILYTLCLLVALLGLSEKTWATNYFRIKVQAVYTGGASGAHMYAGLWSNRSNFPADADRPLDEFTTGVLSSSGSPDVELVTSAIEGVDFLGWYKDEACTILASGSLEYNAYGSSSGIAVSTDEASAPTTTYYAKYAKSSVVWSDYAEAPVAGGKYYLYSAGFNALAGLYTYSDGKVVRGYKDPNQAVLFTISDATNPQITCVDEGVTKYVGKNGTYLATEEPPTKTLVLKSDGSYMINLNNGHSSGYTWWEMQNSTYSPGSCTYSTINESSATQRWRFIPEAAYNALCTVESLNESGSITIDATPTASGSTTVKFNVSEVGPVAAYDYTIEGGDGNFVLGTPTRKDNIITVPVTYTAQNVHSGTFSPISTATVRITAKNPEASTAAGLVPVYVNLSPQFALNVDELDWSYNGETLVETYYAGMEVAASQRERLQNQLIYDPAQTTGVAANYATWTATIIGDYAAQYKFANGTQTVSGPYSPELLDVIFAPTATGEFPATLHVETSYTDANNTVLKCTKDISLYGKAEAVSVITFEADADQSPSDDEHYSYGEIIGTNSKDVSVDLFMVGITGATKVWSDPDDVFEFDVNSIDFSQTNQMLTFRAHRTTPAAAETNHTATLTISGTGSEGPVSAVLTLTYQALPLLTPEVTWNWSTVEEGTVATNPLSTTSDGVWVLTKTGGDKVTYNDEAKSVTTAYVHHEPATATFALSIPQTDTYAAYNKSYELLIGTQQLLINTKAKYDEYVDGGWSGTFDEATGELYYGWYTNMYIFCQGQTKMTFTYRNYSTEANWTVTEYLSDNTTNIIYTGTFNVGANELTFSPNTVKLEFYAYEKAYFSDVRLFDYTDTITANYDKVVLINDNGTIHDLDVTATFSNTYSATVALNAAAQPYFELQTPGKASGASIVFDQNDLGLGMVKDKVITVTLKEGADPAAAAAATAGNACQVTFGDNYTYNHHEFSIPVVLMDAYDVTYKKHAHGTYTVTYADDTEHPQTVSSADFVKHLTSIAPEHTTVTISAPTPASGYVFQGWKINDVFVSCQSSVTKQLDEAATVEPVFAVSDGTFKIDDALFSELNEALGVAGAIADQEPVVVLMKDLALTEPATYTIPAGVTLLIPYKANFSELQTAPEITTTATILSAYRTLTLKEGVNIICNGNICVSGKIMAAGGGNKSAYTTGECGVINMANGGHIELNNGAHLYCWGYIKGQDMDQGNNRQDVGTVTVNSGAVVHENFELGDWRGGTATSSIYFEREEKMLFPFQSYALQNVEIPTTYKYGSKLNPFMVVHTGYGDIPFVVSIIGSEKSLFLLKDEESVIRKWYDPTTDLSCYELSGTAQLDQLILNLPLVGDFASGECNLPISNSMHILLANCNMTLSKPLMVQAGAVIEITNTATINLTAKVHMFDVDEWDKYIHNYYFRSFNNLTSHKDRGAENSKAGLDDAKFIIDGTLNVVSGQGYIYSTAGGANMMGNGGGVVNFQGALPAASEIWQVYVGTAETDNIIWNSTPEAAANLHNEDGSYTKSEGFTSYYNIHGRWFYEANKEPLEDHTYDFYYLDNGNTGDEEWSAAVYSHDKTGLTAGMKWFNVVRAADNCTDIEEDLDKPFVSNWWIDTLVSPAVYYNYTMLGDWHQFQSTEEAGVYSGSNNVLYQKDGCEWVETGAVDENCLYTFYEGGYPVKKALVDGHFIALTSNGYDPAYYHEENEVKTYYICFQGCNWHEATPYVGESKAYTIVAGGTYIWFNNDWLNVEREEPFFYTEDEVTNVRTYYEYVNGEWEIATPYVSVTDAAETRTFYMIKEAFNVASIKKDVTITILRDIPNVTESLVYSTQNTTCTLDLNGHIVTGSCDYLLDINAPGSTFTITDNSTYKNGELRACPSGDARRYGYKLTAGTLKLVAGKMYSTNTTERKNVAGVKNVRITGMTVANGATFTMEGGDFECIDEYNNYGIEAATGGVVNIKGGRVYVRSTVWYSTYGIYLNRGTLNMSGGTVECSAAGNDVVYGVYVNAAASYNSSKGTTSKNHGTLNLSGGSIIAESPKNAYGVYVHRAFSVKSSTDRTIMAEDLGVVTMTGGSITANATTTTNARGIYSFGTVTVSGGTITANVQKSNQSTAYGMVVTHGNTTISGTASISANAPTKAYGVWATADVNTTYGHLHQSNVTINGGTINANATNTTTAYAVYVNGNAKKLTSGNFQGDYAYAGTVTINNGILNANAKTTTAAGVYVVGTKTSGTVSASPTCTINGGKFKMTGTETLNGVKGETLTKAANFKINGGIYSHEGNLATYANAETNKIVVTLPKTDASYPDYKYEVAEGYTITFMNGEETLQASAQKSGTTPTYNGTEPTKASTTEKSYIFDGWSATDGGEVVALATVSEEATYFAHFNETTLKYLVTLDAQTNGGVEETQIIYVDPASAVGTLPTATKAGYTFQGWFSVSAATGGDKLEESTEINADATYYARFTINQHTLTWNLNGGKVTTAGTAAAKNAEGSPSGSVDYKANITAPVIAKTGYTFKNWGVAVAASMPDNDLTYTAVWTPKTNTAYTVKHFKQNLDGKYPAEPADIDELTGTTEAYVTPAVKTYDGFVSPATQTAQITGNGGLVVSYQYARREYTITLDANGGACATASLNVLHGATLTLPEATRDGYTFDGWFTKPVGGDQITNATVIQRNIGTLYAQFTEAITPETNIIAGKSGDADGVDVVITDPDIEAHALIIEKDGRVNITPGASVSVQDFILESDGSKSGQLLGSSADRLTIADGHHAYFDLTLNTHPRNWYAVAVPWEVDAAHGISIKGGRTLKIGRDFDLVYYDGGVRASQGKVYECWQYVNDFAEADQKMIPGQFYMMYFVSDIETIRFESVDNTPFDEAVHGVEVHPQFTGNAGDADWNGIANPKPFHARLNAGGATYGYYLNNGNLDEYLVGQGQPTYQLVNLASYTAIVGKPLYIQATGTEPIVATATIAASAPRRLRDIEVENGIESVYEITFGAENAPTRDNMFIQTVSNKADGYVVGMDLVKAGTDAHKPQLWISRYGNNLAVNTIAPENGVCEYPLTLNVPQSGRYTIAVRDTQGEPVALYLLRNGELLWNLSEGAYTGSFDQGTHTGYSLRTAAKAPQTATGIEEALVDAHGDTRKVLIDNKVYIIRGNEMYTIDGRSVK
jgi:uncharacterized repeat protein (TIGR02543 family)